MQTVTTAGEITGVLIFENLFYETYKIKKYMKLIKTHIEGLVLIKPDILSDERGYFYESYQKEKFSDFGINVDFIQDNESMSSKNVLRGLHFQKDPFAQGKLVRVVCGAVLDIVVDIRKDSPTYGNWYRVELNSENKLIFWVPPGFAHGFLSLKDNTIFQYKCTNIYNRESEGSIIWNDPDLNIDWGIKDPIVSEKDMKSGFFKDI